MKRKITPVNIGNHSIHHTHTRRFGASAFTAFFVIIVGMMGGLLMPQSASAATCNIGAPTTVDQTYINTNTCQDIHITSSVTITFTGAIDLSGTGTFYVDAGITMTESGAINLSDAADALVINGTITHIAGNSTGVNITATTVTISSTGSINVNTKGCPADGGGANGQGPNGSNTCAVSTGGYGIGVNNPGNGAGGASYGGSGGSGSTVAAGAYYGSSFAPTLQGSSGGSITASAPGGVGGGLVQLTVAGTLTVDGSIQANGGNGGTSGTNEAAGGGSGGGINITTGTLAGSSLSFSATGGNGGVVTSAKGGGGGGGRIAITYTSGSPSLSASNFSENGGTATSTAVAGSKGTAYVKKGTSPTADITIYNGFQYDDTDFLESTFTIDSSATSQYCKAASTTPSITAATITINAGVNCTTATITSFNVSATSAITLGTNVAWVVSAQGSAVDWNIPATSYTWTGLTFTGGVQGTFTINDAANISLASSTITANVNWTNLAGLSLDATSTISANTKGCLAAGSADGYGPNGSNVCTVSTSGYGPGQNNSGQGAGGGGHGGSGGAGSTKAASATYDSVLAPVFFGSSGGSTTATYLGGAGGGKIRIDSTGTITIDGSIQANGGNGNTDGSSMASGGGSGGSIYITTSGTLAMTTGTLSANGGNGGVGSTHKGGGGGGGRISINYISGTPTLNSSVVSANGGTATSTAVVGSKGTVFVKKGTSPTADITIYHGFTYDDTDYLENSWTEDSSATNQYCATGTATPSITAATVVLGGGLKCSVATVTSFNVSATSSFSIVSSTSFSVGATGSAVDWNIPAGNNQTWTGLAFTGGAQGTFTINDATSISLVSSTVNANANWTNLTALSVDGASSISANSDGCLAVGSADGYGPNGSNVCTVTTSGYGLGQNNSGQGASGGAYGGAGGAGSTKAASATYGSATAPVFFGSSGGSTTATYLGGTGGGKIRLDSTGTITINGSIQANGANGNTDGSSMASGGGSGGSIYITTSGTLAMTTGTISANGGNGGVGSSQKGGGGGGGRISVSYISGTPTLSSSVFSANGGTATSTAVAGSKGTVYVKKGTSPTADITIYHGFTYDDTDYLENSWTEDPSSTNQYCAASTATPSITAATVVLGGTTNCTPASVTTFNVSATSSFSLASATNFSVTGQGSTVDWNIPAGNNQTWTGLIFTGGAQGAFTINDAISVSLVSSTVNANANWTNLTALTVDAASSIAANSKGCTAPTGGNGYGPNSGTNVCAISLTGFGAGFNNTVGSGGGGYGGGGGNGSSGYIGGVTYGSPTAPVLFGSSGGSTSSMAGGAGGGKIRLDSTGTITINGSIQANGANGSTDGTNSSSGGGSGGSIYITTSAGLAMTTGNMMANGGNGAVGIGQKGGGGGGGRISLNYVSGTPTLNSGVFSVNGGTATSTAVAGSKGTVFVKKGTSPTADVTIYHGFTYDDTDYVENSWTEDGTAINQYCAAGTATPSISVATLTLGGATTCAPATVTSFNVSATTTFTVSPNANFSVNVTKAIVDWNIPAGSSQTWTGVLFTGGAQGDFTINDAVSISLVGSQINANANWTNLTALTVDAASSIAANSKGCTAPTGGNGYGPNSGTNVCAISLTGFGAGFNNAVGSGAGAYGGNGGAGSSGYAGGTTYGSPTAPVLFGSSGGSTSTMVGGAGGGKVRLDSTGTVTINGSVQANGGNGNTDGTNSSSGGGSGGSVYITTSGTLVMATGAIQANGGNGAVGIGQKGGGGGGGRISLNYVSGTPTLNSGVFSVNGGTATSTAVAGSKGTVFVKKGTSPTADVTIYHGFTYDDTDYVENSWTEDPSAMNQYCAAGTATPSITVASVTLSGITTCGPASVTSFNVSASSAFAVSSGTNFSVNVKNATIDFNIPAGNNQTWTNFVFVGGPQGDLTINDAVSISLVGSSINSNINWTNLTALSVDATSSLSANQKGCASSGTGNGYGPNSSTNVCAISLTGFGAGFNNAVGSGAGGYGGNGGAGSSGYAGGTTYGSSTIPVLFGSSGGNTTSFLGGNGGGKIRLVVLGALTLNGNLTANGQAGSTNGTNSSSGGGSGGSIYATVGSLAGTTGVLRATGGNGSVGSSAKGGGGGGGRIACGYGTDSSSWFSTLTAAVAVAGGTATSTAVAGSTGTFSCAALSVPTSPTITSPTAGAIDQARSLTVTSSAYSSDGLSQSSTDWQISNDNTFSNSDCSDTNIVFCSMTSSNFSSIAINSSNGTFQNALSGQTQLGTSTTYYVRVRYNNGAGSSAWSSSVSFTTVAPTTSGVSLGTGSAESWAWQGYPTDQVSSVPGISSLSTLGWIHLNCASYTPCSGGTYNTAPNITVNVSTGEVNGWAWVGTTQADSGTGSSVGWLNFDPAPLADATYADPSCTAPNYFPAPPCYAARIDTTNQQEISGWARFETLASYGDTVLGTTGKNNNWGWVLLRGSNTADGDDFGLVYTGTGLDGWAWSGGGNLPATGFSNDVGFGWINFASAGTGSPLGPTTGYLSTERGDVYSHYGLSNPAGTLSPTQYNATFLILTSDASSIVNFNSQLLGAGTFTNTNWNSLTLPDSTNGYVGSLGNIDLTKLTTVTSGSQNVYGNTVRSFSDASTLAGNKFPDGTVYVIGASCCSGSYTINDSITFTNGTALPTSGSNFDGSGVIVVNGDLTINANTFYNNTALLDIKNLASVAWIVRGDLTIGENVTQLVGSFFVIGDTSIGDGMHDGTITTLPASAEQLNVYGLMMARTFTFQRSYQGTSGNDEPAELIYYDGRILANTPAGLRDYASVLPIVSQQ